MLVHPQLGLPGSDAGAIQIRESQLPFLYQLGRLAVPFCGAGKHPFRTGALSNRAGHELSIGDLVSSGKTPIHQR